MILSHLSQTTSWASCKASPHEKRKHHFLRLNLESSYGCMVLNAKTHTQTKLTKLLPFPHKFWTMMNYEQCIFARSCVRWSSDRQSNSAKIKWPEAKRLKRLDSGLPHRGIGPVGFVTLGLRLSVAERISHLTNDYYWCPTVLISYIQGLGRLLKEGSTASIVQLKLHSCFQIEQVH